MFEQIEIDKVEKLEKLVGEYNVWMHTILPYGKMKVKIYQDQDSTYTGYTDIKIKRKIDGISEASIGYGKTQEEALKDTIRWFMQILKEDYINGLTEKDIEYVDIYDF